MEALAGGGQAREGFRIHPRLEATITVVAPVNQASITSWDGTGVIPDIDEPAAQASQPFPENCAAEETSNWTQSSMAAVDAR